jgi:hypothetical protein
MNAEQARDELVAELVRIGELLINGEGREEVDAYFSPTYTSHGADGSEWSNKGLQGYRAAPRDIGGSSGTRFRGITDDVPRSRSMLHPMAVEVHAVERT